MLFMGQEWGASTPFLFFTEHTPELGRLVTEGRRKEFAHFPEFRDPEAAAQFPTRKALRPSEGSKLDWSELTEHAHAGVLALCRECLRLRASDAAFRPDTRDGWSADVVDGAVAIRCEDGAHSWLLLATLNRACQVSLAAMTFADLTMAAVAPRSLLECAHFGGWGRSVPTFHERC